MAKGQIAKQEITKKILETFEGSFLYDGGKEIRIPIIEEGNLVQVKVTLTCAKVNVAPEGEEEQQVESAFPTAPKAASLKPTEEEKQNVAAMLKSLGL